MRFMHTMIRIRDLDRSIEFYTKQLGMQVLKQNNYPSGEFTLAFLGYGTEKDNTVIELTHNWDDREYEHGNAFGHLAIGVDDIKTTVENMRQTGVEITREPGPMKFGGNVSIAFIKDPDGYTIELIEE